MIEETGQVVRVEGDHVWVETQRKSACGSCSANKGCGTATLGKVFGNRQSVVRVLNTLEVEPGDTVVLGLQESALVRGSIAIYAVPLLCLILGSLGAQAVGAGDGATTLAGLLSLAAGFGWVRYFASHIRSDARYQPVILRRLPRYGLSGHGVLAP
jgi:sigma-E factor negative regulatory protein RseC